MSRIGKQPIHVPPDVTVHIAAHTITVKGPKGSLEHTLHPDIAVAIKENIITVSPRNATKKSGAIWGLTRALVANMTRGASEGYLKELEFEGIGFRAAVEGRRLTLQLGFSHPVFFDPPEDITLGVQKNVISVSGASKQLVGQTAARIRALKPPEPYKGKGIRYRGEVIRRKTGKKAVSAG